MPRARLLAASVVRRLSFVLFSLMLAGIVTAQTRDMKIETAIENDLARVNPALVEPFRAARIAMDKGDFSESARLLAPVVAAAPAFDPAVRRLGNSLANSGRPKEGLALVERAVALNRSAANLSTLAALLAFPAGGKPGRTDQERAFTLFQEAGRLRDGDDASTLVSIAHLALNLNKLGDARAATLRLREKFPQLMQTHYFAAIIAASDERWLEADDEIGQAEKLGLDAATVRQFRDSGVGVRATGWRVTRITLLVIGTWALGLVVLCGGGFALSKITLRQVERADPTVPIAPGEQKLRRIYRTVLNIAGVYYYISLPIVLVIVVAACAAIVCGFLLIGWVPIKLTVILGIGAVATIWAMGRSLFLKAETRDPGHALARDEAESLWQLTEEVAAAMNTRPIDEIRITPGTDLCVYERGTWREKLENRAPRVLVLGAAMLNDFKQEDFRCVLAHEYGHFANRDTAGGDVAMRVQNDMLKFYYAMLAAGQATWLNMAFHFLRAYHFIFRRISHGATRLQEVLADRVAAQLYGAPAFEGGLRHVIRRSIEFEAHANREINAALQARRPIQNLYAPVAPGALEIEAEFAKAINRPTTADDTHPGPHDRFRLIAKLPPPKHAPSSGVVWDLFKDREALLARMTAEVEKNVADHRS